MIISLYFNETKKRLNCFIYMTLAKLEQSRQENLKVIKNTLPVKSANPESLKIIATVAKAFQLMCP